MSPLDQISSLLSRLMAGEGSIPLSVSLKEDEEIQTLRNQILALESRILALQAESDRLQQLYLYESSLNNRLIDLLRDNSIKVGREFFQRPE